MPLLAPHLFAPEVERWRLLAWGGSGFVALSPWLLPGYELCSALAAREAAELGGSAAPLDLRLQSSRTLQISGSSARAGEWFRFLNCGAIPPWSTAFNDFGKGG